MKEYNIVILKSIMPILIKLATKLTNANNIQVMPVQLQISKSNNLYLLATKSI